jgi:hypothetical protein
MKSFIWSQVPKSFVRVGYHTTIILCDTFFVTVWHCSPSVPASSTPPNGVSAMEATGLIDGEIAKL